MAATTEPLKRTGKEAITPERNEGRARNDESEDEDRTNDPTAKEEDAKQKSKTKSLTPARRG